MGELTIRADDAGNGVCVIRVNGPADVKNAGRLDLELSRLCTRRSPLTVLDLSALTFIASLGLGALVSFQRAMRRHGGVVRLAGLSSQVAGVFEHANLDKVFEVHDTVEAALSAGPAANARSPLS